MAENQAPQAIEQLKKATEADPSNVDLMLAYGEILMQANQRAEGEKVLMSMDLTKVKDPFPYMNIVIGKINDQKATRRSPDRQADDAVPDRERALLLSRPRQPGRQEDAGGEGRPREVRRRAPTRASCPTRRRFSSR